MAFLAHAVGAAEFPESPALSPVLLVSPAVPGLPEVPEVPEVVLLPQAPLNSAEPSANAHVNEFAFRKFAMPC